MLNDKPQTTLEKLLDNGAIYKADGETDADFIKRGKQRFGISTPSELSLGTATGDTLSLKRLLCIPLTRISLWFMRQS